jgi:hypothetical protein
MPVKGTVTACTCVLFDRPPTVDQLAEALTGFEIVSRRSKGGERWEFGGPSVGLAYRPDVNGYVSVDTVDRPWPDHMGDPKDGVTLFGAWSLGHFGPFTFPDGLKRAAQQCWAWPDGKTAPERHRAFVRLRTSYTFGLPQGDQTPLFPPDYDPVGELRFLTDAAAAVLALPEAVCYFNPNGEVLRPVKMVADRLLWADESGYPPLDLWANVRLFNVDDGWHVMDTVGNGQLDHLGLPTPFPDLEACFPRGACDVGEVDPFLRNTTLYVLRQGPVFRGGDTIDGPGGRWRAWGRKRGLVTPPRATVRFFLDGVKPPDALFADPDDQDQ